MLVLLLRPPVSHLTPSSGAYAALGWPLVLVLLAGPWLPRRVRGADVGRSSLTAYPSTRRMGIAFLTAAVPHEYRVSAARERGDPPRHPPRPNQRTMGSGVTGRRDPLLDSGTRLAMCALL